MDLVLQSIATVLTWQNLAALFAGSIYGIVIGVLPGLGPSAGMALALPLVILVEGTLILGIASFLALAGVYVRDLAQVVWLGTSVLFYLSPGIYPIERVPAGLRPFYGLNPFATILPSYVTVILDGTLPPLAPLLIWLVIGLLIALAGVVVADGGVGPAGQAITEHHARRVGPAERIVAGRVEREGRPRATGDPEHDDGGRRASLRILVHA